MPKKVRELSPVEISRLAKVEGKTAVGGVPGLHLWVKSPVAVSWVLRVLVGGVRRDIGLGGYPATTFAMAKEAARQAREQIRQGIDPIEEKKRLREHLAAEAATNKTFEQCVAGFIEAKGDEWRNPKHRQQWENTLATHAAALSKMRVRDIQLPHVLGVLEPIWREKTETATRVRGRIEQVLDWSTVRGYRTGENPARWRGHLEQLLPKPGKVAKVEHHKALPVDDVPDFMIRLRDMEGFGVRALEFAVLTAARSGEVRGAHWPEIDLVGKVWIVPADRMKAHREHRVPLSKAAVKLLKALDRVKGETLVFPSTREKKPLSDMTLSAVLRRMKVDAVPHGFRSSFRDWAAERTAYPRELAEAALAHVLENKVEAAYQRSDLLARRAKMMEDWATFCATPVKKGNVVPMARKK